MSVHHVNVLALNYLANEPAIAQPLPVATVADGRFYLGAPGGQLVGVGQQPDAVALGAVRLSQLHRIGHGARKKLSR